MGYVKDITIGSSTYPVEPMLYAVAGGTASAITASIPNFDLHTGACVQIKMTVDNIAGPTLKVENSGYNVIKYKGAGLTAGFLKAGLVYAFVYDGVDWVLIGQILEVVDSLSNTSTDKALSAAQGKALQDSKVNTADIVNDLTSMLTNAPASAALVNGRFKIISSGSLHDILDSGVYFVTSGVTDRPTTHGGLYIVARLSDTLIVGKYISYSNAEVNVVYEGGSWYYYAANPYVVKISGKTTSCGAIGIPSGSQGNKFLNALITSNGPGYVIRRDTNYFTVFNNNGQPMANTNVAFDAYFIS